MIVKNEAANLAKILNDIHKIVDELVVVDTGSNDGTVEIARSYGAIIGHFEWCDNFSAARNASIELATTDYLLWLDADDRIEAPDQKKLEKLKQRLPLNRNRAFMLRISCDTSGDCNTSSYQLRIFPRLETVRFEGRVHEQIWPSLKAIGVEQIKAEITIRHTGYGNESIRIEKARRNLDILNAAIAAEPQGTTLSMYFHLAMSQFALGHYEETIAVINQIREKAHAENWFKYCFILSSDSYIHLGRLDEALREVTTAIEAYPESGLLQYSRGVIALQMGRFDLAIDAFETAARRGIELETYPLPPDIQSKLPHYYANALEQTGRLDEAARAYEAALNYDPIFLPSLKALGLVRLKQGRPENALDLLRQAHDQTTNLDPVLWLSLARLERHMNHQPEALELYTQVLAHYPTDLDALCATVRISIELDLVETLLRALEQLIIIAGLSIDREINSVSEFGELCAEIAVAIKKTSQPHAQDMAEAALLLEPSCIQAHLLLADLFSERNLTTDAIEHLKQALSFGAKTELIEQRLQIIQKGQLA